MLVKHYGQPAGSEQQRRYIPPECIGIDVRRVEHQNLTMRMGMRRFTPLTNAFSKKLENHLHMLRLYFVHYNWCRRHLSLRRTPAMAAGLSEMQHSIKWIVGLIDARTPPPDRPSVYRRRDGGISN